PRLLGTIPERIHEPVAAPVSTDVCPSGEVVLVVVRDELTELVPEHEQVAQSVLVLDRNQAAKSVFGRSRQRVVYSDRVRRILVHPRAHERWPTGVDVNSDLDVVPPWLFRKRQRRAGERSGRRTARILLSGPEDWVDVSVRRSNIKVDHHVVILDRHYPRILIDPRAGPVNPGAENSSPPRRRWSNVVECLRPILLDGPRVLAPRHRIQRQVRLPVSCEVR